MKIGLVVPGGVDPSGERRVIPALLALIRRLSARHEVCVFALRQEDRPRSWDLLGARVHNIGVANTRRRALRAIAREHRAASFDVLHAIWSEGPGLVAVAAARWLGVPSLVHLGGGELIALPEIGYGGALTWKARARERLVLRAATQVTAASAALLGALAALGVVAERVPLGVDLELWRAREPVRRSARRARLIHVASLNRVKDQSTLLRALLRLRERGVEFEMQIVGEDTLGGEVQALAERLGLSGAVTFHGFLPQQQLRPLLEAADVMLISSRHEAGPLAMHEAAALGVPTVGTAVGQIADWAPQAALAAPVGDADGLARHVAALLSDEALRLRVGRAALTRATRESADFTARAFEAIYERITARG